MAAASLATLSGDRFVLGLGLQSKRLVEGLHGTTYGGLGAMRETIHVVRRLLAGDSVTFDGQAVRIEGRRRNRRSRLAPGGPATARQAEITDVKRSSRQSTFPNWTSFMG